MIEQPSLCRFLLPLRRVVVPVEDDPLVLLDHLGQQRLDGGVELLSVLLRLLELGRDVIERFGDRQVERDVRERDTLTGRDGAELELVAGERERAGAVPVARVLLELRERRRAELHDRLGHRLAAPPLLDRLEHVVQLRAEEDRDDRRRRLVRPEAVVLARARDGRAQ